MNRETLQILAEETKRFVLELFAKSEAKQVARIEALEAEVAKLKSERDIERRISALEATR